MCKEETAGLCHFISRLKADCLVSYAGNIFLLTDLEDSTMLSQIMPRDSNRAVLNAEATLNYEEEIQWDASDIDGGRISLLLWHSQTGPGKGNPKRNFIKMSYY